jgi:CHAD domain-containing protein
MGQRKSISRAATNGQGARRRVVFSAAAPARLTKLLKQLCREYFHRLRKCRRNPSQRAVHDLRVEARRLLSLLDLFEPFLRPQKTARARTTLKRELDCFDDLRDTHVQLKTLEDLCEHFSAARDFRKFLKKREAKLRDRTRRNAKQLPQKRLARILSRCRRDVRDYLEKAGPRQASLVLLRLLAGGFAQVAGLKDRIDPTNPRSIHCTRIAFKRFRYMIEPLAGELDWATEALLKHMRQYQGAMGSIQDSEVLRRCFEKFARKKRLKAEPALALTEELLRRRERFIAVFLPVAHELELFRPPSPSRLLLANPAPDSNSVRKPKALRFGQVRPSVKSLKRKTS